MTSPSETRPAAASSHLQGPGAAGVAWGLLAAALLLFLFFGDAPERTLFWDAVFDTGHVPLFGLLAVAVLRLLRTRVPAMAAGRAWWTAFGTIVAAGVVTELLQNLQPNREPSFGDFARDLAGAGAFLLAAAAWPRWAGGPSWAGTRRTRRTALGVAALLLAISGFQLGMTLSILAARQLSMPTLYALDGSWWERPLIRPGDSRLTPHAMPSVMPAGVTEPLARLDLRPAVYPGISFVEPFPDWRPYHRLVFTVVSDLDAPMALTIRVHDARHDQRYEDRFNRTLKIIPGVNRVVIPLEDIRTAPDRREMDMSRIRGIVIFAYRPAGPQRFYLSPLRLE